MSRKKKQAVPAEVIAEGSGPVEGAVVHVGIDVIGGADEEIDALAAAAADVAVEATELFDGEAIEVIDAAASLDPPAEVLDEVSEEDGDADVLGAVLPTSAASMDERQLRHLVEALVFASDKPITIQRLRQLTRVSDTRRLEQALVDLAEDYKERGIVLQQVSGGYQFRTRTQFSTWVQQLIAGRPVRLSRAQLETLAIIAYRQPITRPEIDDIRGVDSSATLKLLLDRALIRILGKREEAGRPMLYGTTKEFLDFFSLGDLRELPTLREYSELTDESRRVMTEHEAELGIDPDAPADADAASADVPEAPMTIDDIVASYNSSMQPPEPPVFVTQADTSAAESEPDVDPGDSTATE